MPFFSGRFLSFEWFLSYHRVVTPRHLRYECWFEWNMGNVIRGAMSNTAMTKPSKSIQRFNESSTWRLEMTKRRQGRGYFDISWRFRKRAVFFFGPLSWQVVLKIEVSLLLTLSVSRTKKCFLKGVQLHLMVIYLVVWGRVVWISGIPLWKGLLLIATPRIPDYQCTISWRLLGVKEWSTLTTSVKTYQFRISQGLSIYTVVHRAECDAFWS